MPEERHSDNGEGLDVNPEVAKLMDHLDTVKIIRLATIFFTAEKIAQKKYCTSIDGLRQKGEPTEDYTEITKVIKEANKIVGSEDEYQYDHAVWEESKQKGEETLSFEEWRKINREDYCQRLKELEQEA